MGKIKTHKASAKRFSLTGTGKVKLNHTNRRHKLGIKTAKRKRQLRGGAVMSEAMAANVKKMINK
ncbi:MAG: 50S ribosomal protein L35 [Clostridia bacterium]|nr:50S ribosomal protein L35 [Oscillospiraceae bacterium]MBQ8276579.1 50S ribosomal protein L35 [Clostridia bacterium]